MATPPYTLSLHDSQTRRKQVFTPLDPENVRVYYCGPTVYDAVHIGNLRAMLSADILVRLLRALFPRVTFVRNITDVDDKITARARDNGEDIASLTARTTIAFHEDVAALGIQPPDIEPRATHHIDDMLAMIAQLIASGHAYEAEGHVLFAVDRCASYGALSGRSPDDLLAGARVEIAPYKRHPGDFVLWKPSSPEQPGWDSPYGRGRPGWHIECSAMSHRYLGESFDIHGGGDDLLFPHHENERAQSLCCNPGSSFARYWLHNAMLLSNGEKMSKSLGNFFTIREVLTRAPAEALRLLMLGAHYRSVLDFTWEKLEDAKRTLDRFYRALEKHPSVTPGAVDADFMSALCDDMNTPLALSCLHPLADAALAGDAQAAASLKASGAMIGLLGQSADDWFRAGSDDGAIDALIVQRAEAKKARDFALADSIRTDLAAQGIILEDTAQGTKWRRA
ncbi:cysteine--tRNA ligase [Asaia bogorensis]|uniref:Cysteine--tRNA ligase n=1 Tax=Asaia bogorensis NBRC 16594 TaxID=1231624 RepID=A0AAN4R0L1_9PROT|nr:cysteine--tRNA ligase [Asaia bogorensis]BAT20179.1 cysteinyl-tRNA synthetase [Asaia bogorensis NBRC 16594]GBQ80203.1 cysteinyl-tRNA synthetase [Asaia bogorensis NBRC 16594]GEL52402.1 cysteine--tRNA ligase [Asaia bogorensis NBRC 16594]